MPDTAVIPRFSQPSPPRAGEDGIGSLIHHQRRRLRLSLQDVAVRAGCSRSYLSQIENGRVGPPGDELLARIEGALGLAPGALLTPARSQREHRERSALSALRADVRRLQSTLVRVRACLADNSAAAPLIDEALGAERRSDCPHRAEDPRYAGPARPVADDGRSGPEQSNAPSVPGGSIEFGGPAEPDGPTALDGPTQPGNPGRA